MEETADGDPIEANDIDHVEAPSWDCSKPEHK
jgi:hypothetical protein